MATTELRGYWDYENSPTETNFRTGATITQNMQEMAGNMPFTLKVYGKRDRIRDDEPDRNKEIEDGEEHKEGFRRNGIDFIDVPSDKPNAADRLIIEDMFLDAIKNKTPCYYMLFSGDADFTYAFESLTELGNSCLLVYQQSSYSKKLLAKSASSYKWEPIRFDNKGFINENGELNVLPRLHPVTTPPSSKRKKLGKATAVFWDFRTFRLPRTVHLIDAMNTLKAQMGKHLDMVALAEINYHLYDEENRLRAYSSLPGVKCCNTSVSRKEKHRHIQNLLIPDMMSYALKNPSSNIVLITGDNDYSGSMNKLKRRGHTVLVYTPVSANSHNTDFWKDEHVDLKLAATVSTVCDWETTSFKETLKMF